MTPVRAARKAGAAGKPAGSAAKPPAGDGNAGGGKAGGGPVSGRAATGTREVTPSRYRRRRLVASAVVLVLALGGAAAGVRYLLVSSGLLVVQEVAVHGASTVPAADILAAAAIRQGTPLASLDLTAIAARVGAIPGIGSAEATRSWPSTVDLTVTERTPVALASVDGKLVLVDATGTAYGAVPDPPPPLPRLVVSHVAPNDQDTTAALAVLAALPTAVRSTVVEVDAAQPSAVVLRLGGNKQVRWGRADASERKAAVLVPLLSRPGTTYDVTSPDLPTVR